MASLSWQYRRGNQIVIPVALFGPPDPGGELQGDETKYVIVDTGTNADLVLFAEDYDRFVWAQIKRARMRGAGKRRTSRTARACPGRSVRSRSSLRRGVGARSSFPRPAAAGRARRPNAPLHKCAPGCGVVDIGPVGTTCPRAIAASCPKRWGPPGRGICRAAARARPQGVLGLRPGRGPGQRGPDPRGVSRHPARAGLPRLPGPFGKGHALAAEQPDGLRQGSRLSESLFTSFNVTRLRVSWA